MNSHNNETSTYAEDRKASNEQLHEILTAHLFQKERENSGDVRISEPLESFSVYDSTVISVHA